MCGIVITINDNPEIITKKLLKKISHRGEDKCDIKNFENISFGFARLAINDLSTNGNQPFEFKNYIGVFNAQIYNHKELKKEHNLNIDSNCDTRVILPLYDKYKENILSLLDGFYSGAIYDKETKEIIFIRDYIGKKPLFFAYNEATRYITSELKSLPEVDNFEIIPKGISKISNNKLITIKPHNNKYLNKPSKYELKDIITNAVFKRVDDISNTKFGIFISGGLDSSIIATLVASLKLKNVHYYCILDPHHPDYEYIKIIKKSLGLSDSSFSQIPLPTQEEFLNILQTVIYYTESYNPSIVSNGIGAYILSKEAKKDGLKVVLTGDGADEMFMGYYDKVTLPSNKPWQEIHKALIDNLHTTEIRRIDLSCMANTIEIRAPFLDKNIYDTVSSFSYEDLFGVGTNNLNKNILREAFKDDLPYKIYNRKKVSFDVGSGIQKMMVDLCEEQSITEEDYLKDIWDKLFFTTLSKFSKKKYFYSYPAFDKVIPSRGKKYIK